MEEVDIGHSPSQSLARRQWPNAQGDSSGLRGLCETPRPKSCCFVPASLALGPLPMLPTGTMLPYARVMGESRV